MARKGAATRRSSGRTILVVDDSREILEATQSLLEREGHRVLIADNGIDALDCIRQEDVDLLLVDYFMPQMTGEDVVRELRRFNSRIQVILQTGYASERPPREMLARLDIQGYCDKSGGPEELLLWVDVGLKFAQQVRTLDLSRQGLRYILDVTPDLHKIQPLEDLLQGILFQVSGLLGAVNSFVAVRTNPGTLPAEPVTEGFLAMMEDERDLVIHASIGRFAGQETIQGNLPEENMEELRIAMQSGDIATRDGVTVVPLKIGHSTLGVIYLDKVPEMRDDNREMLHIFANQAAVAVQNAQLYQMATLDPLTGVYARRFWEQMALREVRTAFRFRYPISLAVFDLDHFKEINDTQGHLVGDQALETLGKVLRSTTRSSDVAGRFGGDEFMVVLPRTHTEGAQIFCDRVLKELDRQEVRGPHGVCQILSSIGVCTLDAHAFENSQLPRPMPNGYFQSMVRSMFQRADEMVYASKRAGGHRHGVHPDMTWNAPLGFDAADSNANATNFLAHDEGSITGRTVSGGPH